MNITNPVKILLTIIIIALIGAVFYFTNYQVKIKEIKTLEADLKAKETRLADVKNQVRDLPNLIAERDRLKVENEALLQGKLVPEETKDFVPNYLSQIETLIKEIRVKTGDESFDITEIRPGAESVEQPAQKQDAKTDPAAQKQTQQQAEAEAVFASFPKRTFEMTMKGRYNTLIEFLTQIGDLKLKRLVTINRIGLSPGEAKESNSSPVLNITIPVTAYLKQGGPQQ